MSTILDSKFPSAQKSYSYEYPGGNNATDDIIKIRRESVQKRADDLNKLLN